MTAEKPPIAVALDVPTLDRAEELAAAVADHVAVCKVGMELFYANGPDAVRRVATHAPVFLDLKLYDIPNTVRSAARVLGGLGIAMLNAHASGGAPVIRALAEGLAQGHADAGLDGPPPMAVGVTVLTSLDDAVLASVNSPPAAVQVPRLAEVAVDAGAGGLVCAPTDVAAVRAAVGDDVVLITPGVRPSWAAVGDQVRIATPAGALAAGSDLLVVGRPITRADDPAAAAARVAAELRGVGV